MAGKKKNRCCAQGVKRTDDSFIDWTLVPDGEGTEVCNAAGNLRPISQSIFQAVAKENGLCAAFPTNRSGLKICNSCKSKVTNWDPPFTCTLCERTCHKGNDKVKSLGKYANSEVGETSKSLACGTCYSQRYHAVNSREAPPVPSPSKIQKDRGRPTREMTGMSGPKGKNADICGRAFCTADCKRKMYHPAGNAVTVEVPTLLRFLNRTRCAFNDGACPGVMSAKKFKHGYGHNAQIDLKCPVCHFSERLQMQQDLLKVATLDTIPEELPDRASEAAQPNVIPVPPDFHYGGLPRSEAKAMVSENTLFSLKLQAALAMEGMSGEKVQRALEMAGVYLPPDNTRKGRIEKILCASAAEATKVVDKLTQEALQRRKDKKSVDKITHVEVEHPGEVVLGDCGYQSPYEAAHGGYILVEAALGSGGVGMLCMVTMSKNAKPAEVAAGIHNYFGTSKAMENAGMKVAFKWLAEQVGVTVYAVVTDGDTAARDVLIGSSIFEASEEGSSWYHLYDVNHFFKNLYGRIDELLKDPSWRQEHAAEPGTIVGGRVVGCQNYVPVGKPASEATGKTKTCRLPTLEFERSLLRVAVRRLFEEKKQRLLEGKIDSVAAFVAEFTEDLQSRLDHCFGDHDKCVAEHCSRAPKRRKAQTLSVAEAMHVTCPAAERAIRRVVAEYFSPDMMTRLVAPLIGNPLTNKVESANHINCRFNPKGVHLSAMQYFRGAMMAYMDTGIQWLLINAEATDPDPEPWQAAVLHNCAEALSIPPPLLAMSKLTLSKVKIRNQQRKKRSKYRSTTAYKKKRAVKRRLKRLKARGKLREEPGLFYSHDELIAAGKEEYIGRGGGILIDKQGKSFRVVTDKLVTSRANRTAGGKRVKSGIKETTRELDTTLKRLLGGQTWNRSTRKFYGWTDPSKLGKTDPNYAGVNTKRYVLSKIVAVRVKQAGGSNDGAGPATLTTDA
eukprot:m.421991 g.421991  ORF g.421991 m.421991 type:complete len:953 (-) comp35698_c0_seq1:35-2893(-)